MQSPVIRTSAGSKSKYTPPKGSTRYNPKRYLYKPIGKYKTMTELRKSPEWKAYIADDTRKHDMLMKQNHSSLTKKQQRSEAKYNG